jgi:hypothetical protein
LIALQAAFEAPVFRSASDFTEFRNANEQRLGELYQYQRSLGTDGAQVAFEGLCGLCSTVTNFRCPTQGGDPCPRGLEPNWRETTHCGCWIGLNSRERLLLHRWLRDAGGGGEKKVGILGDGERVRRWLDERGHAAAVSHLAPFQTGTLDAILSPDHLDRLADLPGQLGAMLGQLRPGGALVLTVAFFYSRELSNLASGDGEALLADARHSFGWDLLTMMEAAGFADVSAEIAWSEELGYMGSFNLVFAGTRP